MLPEIKSFLANIGAIGIMVGVFLILAHPQWTGLEQAVDIVEEKATTTPSVAPPPSVVQSVAAGPDTPVTAPTQEVSDSISASPPIVLISKPAQTKSVYEIATTTDTFQVARVPNPYPFPPLSFTAINESTRAALVNILCGARTGTFRPISASGVIIDPRGVILTNAHVAQYFLLSTDPEVDLSCVIRSGAPAYPKWNAEVLFIPPSWVKEHAGDLKEERPLGTGEYDYALLRVTSTITGQPLQPLPFLSVDARENIAFTDDQVLAASYPAEFAGGIVTQLNLYPASTVTSIKNMMTLTGNTVDVVSLGGIIAAQSGSSGGAVTNGWGRLVGVISTTSEGETTAKRDLHAITLSYINRSIASESGLNLSQLLAGDIAGHANLFNKSIAPALRKLLTDQISNTAR